MVSQLLCSFFVCSECGERTFQTCSCQSMSKYLNMDRRIQRTLMVWAIAHPVGMFTIKTRKLDSGINIDGNSSIRDITIINVAQTSFKYWRIQVKFKLKSRMSKDAEMSFRERHRFRERHHERTTGSWFPAPSVGVDRSFCASEWASNSRQLQ